MTEPTTVSQHNAALVRRGRCWECVHDEQDAGEHVRVELHWDCGPEWFVCPQCDKRWMIEPDHIIERLPLAEFADAITKQTLRVTDHVRTEAIILEDGTRLPVYEGDTWPVPLGARYCEWTWRA